MFAATGVALVRAGFFAVVVRRPHRFVLPEHRSGKKLRLHDGAREEASVSSALCLHFPDYRFRLD
jgi:hypothetical protein